MSDGGPRKDLPAVAWKELTRDIGFQMRDPTAKPSREYPMVLATSGTETLKY